ncbi:DMT family transporter [Acuticoccus sp. I52.16.1]|uniref:DMT family transporter n=1 Tax=Acuticoccus sp. I52.16.1 TaxID=2928472 RepID=UPI001FCFD2F0|nr:DMT family transporter [Acuticoccus sp. I52.16.1]UOM35843.1 DMT family transporter [Acuticoccus sp. I52.16.1]
MPLPPASTEAGASLRGIILMVYAVSMFACLDSTAKWLGASMDAVHVVWLRYAAHVLLLCLFLRVWRDITPFKTKHPFMQALRGLTLLGSTFFNFWALQYLQLGETSAIMFSAPLVVTALAGPFLGEKVGVRRWAAVCVGFVGVLVVLRPGTGAMHWAAMLSICGMLNYSIYVVLTRRMHRTENSISLLMLSALVGVVVLAPVAPGALLELDGWQWVLALMMGLFGASGHFALTVAHRYASASTLAPFIYTQMVWMILFGWAIFHQVPDTWTFVGTGIIAAAGIYILHRERIRGQVIAQRDPAVH